MKRAFKRFVVVGLLPLLLSCASNNPDTTTSKEEGTTSTFSPEIIDPIPVSSEDQGDSSSEGEYEQWIPEIIDLDDPSTNTEVEVDDTVYDYSTLAFNYPSGGYDLSEGKYTSNSYGSLAVNTDETSPYTHGTFSADIYMNEKSDTGLVFGLSSNSTSYWEGSGVSYYFFFVNFEGIVYLGKTDNGTWSALATSFTIDLNSRTEPINLKVLFYGNKIICFADGELALAVRDRAYLTGTHFGFRTGSNANAIGNLFLSSDRVL